MKYLTRKWRHDFAKSSSSENWYDLEEDWGLIATSLKAQYGYSIREKINTMDWGELAQDISCLMSETPLGKIVQIRSENDREKLKNFTPEQLAIRRKYRNKIAKNINKEEYDRVIAEFQKAFAEMAGN